MGRGFDSLGFVITNHVCCNCKNKLLLHEMICVVTENDFRNYKNGIRNYTNEFCDYNVITTHLQQRAFKLSVCSDTFHVDPVCFAGVFASFVITSCIAPTLCVILSVVSDLRFLS